MRETLKVSPASGGIPRAPIPNPGGGQHRWPGFATINPTARNLGYEAPMPQFADKLRRGIARLERLLADTQDPALAHLYAELDANRRMLADIERAGKQTPQRY